MLIQEAESKASSWHSTSELWDDGVIDPRETRNYLGFSLAILYNQKIIHVAQLDTYQNFVHQKISND